MEIFLTEIVCFIKKESTTTHENKGWDYLKGLISVRSYYEKQVVLGENGLQTLILIGNSKSDSRQIWTAQFI